MTCHGRVRDGLDLRKFDEILFELKITDEEWAEFLGHFERRKVAFGDCGRAYGTSCPHEHSCVRCPVLRIDPDQRSRLADIRDNLTARIAEAEREGWLGEAEGLRVSLAAARDKLAQLDEADPPGRHRQPRHPRLPRHRRPHRHRARKSPMMPPGSTAAALRNQAGRIATAVEGRRAGPL